MTEPRTNGSNDEDLMLRLQAGDLAALETLYDRHHRTALALAYRVLADQSEAEEVVQETFLTVWRRSVTYRADRGQVSTWLLSIARNRAVDRIRRVRRLGPSAELDESLTDPDAPGVWEEVDRRVRREEIREALGALPTEQREVIDLVYYGGLTHQEIADSTGVPSGTVKSRLRLALNKLRTVLGPEDRGIVGVE